VNPSEHEKANFAAAAAEAKKVGILLQVHAVSPQAMVGALQLGATRFVHSTHFDWMTPEQAREVRDAGAMVASSTNVPGAVFDVFSHDNQPHYRSGKHWPEGDFSGEAQGRAAAYMPLNLRTLYDNGVEIAFSGDAFPYTTQTPYQQGKVLEQELKTLNLLFSPQDMIQIMGQHSADFINHGKDRGTLEVGKLADILVLNGNPLDGYWNFLNPVVVVKGGEIVVDKRAAARKPR
jgi:imidazolonepropionase-like amidohydrolase